MIWILFAACTNSDALDSKGSGDTNDSGAVDTSDTGLDDSDTADSDTADPALSVVSGSFEDLCHVDLGSDMEGFGADASGSLTVIQDGVQFGPWAAFGANLPIGDLYDTYLYACVAAEDGTPGGDLSLVLTVALYPDSDPTNLAVTKFVPPEGGALGLLTDIAGVTPVGAGQYFFTSGTASMDTALRDGKFMSGAYDVDADIAVDVTVDVSW